MHGKDVVALVFHAGHLSPAPSLGRRTLTMGTARAARVTGAGKDTQGKDSPPLSPNIRRSRPQVCSAVCAYCTL